MLDWAIKMWVYLQVAGMCIGFAVLGVLILLVISEYIKVIIANKKGK